ncbi:alkene reductase [Sphingobium sp. WCS2017Hpa-17]|uniref:alkene reductase n=1 Tax=Sphingobium sp. WCS2017Hpa-17 TaxID=3073638 RepID=UPI00288A82DA|nr:alkene reductase [Sphingobium sp. WCS2017Hpa-17]
MVADNLFEPVALGDLEMSNPIVMAPMTRSRAGAGDEPTELMARYYAQRATAGLIVTEGTQPSAAGKGYCRTPGISTPAQCDGWSSVADAVHEKGGKIVLQLMHCGRVASRVNKADDSDIVAPSAVRAGGTIFTDAAGLVEMDMPRALDLAEIPQVVEEFAQAARNARAAGLDGVELHCASGYLPMQFLSPNANRRTDAYGGSVANRIRFTVEVLEAIAAEIGPGRVGFRICPGFAFNDVHDDDPVTTYSALLKAVSPMNLAYLHLIRLVDEQFDSLDIVTRSWNGRTILNNGLNVSSASELLASGAADAVSFGRDFIANPDLVRRFREGLALASFNPAQLYTSGAQGYVDYPTYSPSA